MTSATRTVPLLVAFYLLTSAAMADAACAWIVWRNSVALASGSDLKDHWFPEKAVDTHRECEAIATAQNASEHRATERASSLGIKRLVDISYLCLPDTVDPRGPKGK